MLFAGEEGQAVFLQAVEGDETSVERLRDMLALRLSDAGISHRLIGRVLGLSRPRVSQRLAAMPESARRLTRADLGRLDRA
jgi:predicted transcriptional regulator